MLEAFFHSLLPLQPPLSSDSLQFEIMLDLRDPDRPCRRQWVHGRHREFFLLLGPIKPIVGGLGSDISVDSRRQSGRLNRPRRVNTITKTMQADRAVRNRNFCLMVLGGELPLGIENVLLGVYIGT
jgi:hypothetical protein